MNQGAPLFSPHEVPELYLECSIQLSLPGLTWQSIRLRKKVLAKKMDARVKPAHDKGRTHDGRWQWLT
jgi:hypothetical protein